MATISVVLATYNEEKNIAGCLQSVKGLADEIIVVDGSSADKTASIAREYGAKVKVLDNPPIFHINKQKAIDMATKDWILQLDADERVTPELVEEIKEKIQHESDFNGFWLPRKNYFLGRFLMKGGQYPDYTLRLYRRGRGKLPQKSVHEQADVEGKTAYLHNAMLHYPYENFNVYIRKWRRYNRLLKTEIQEKLKKENAIMQLFIALQYIIIKPIAWFGMTYLRHKGFMDGWQGFVFSFFSALRFPVSYMQTYEREK